MRAFDVMAEAKMRQWEQEVREGKTKPISSAKPLTLDFSESLERRLYRDIRETIIKAYMQTGATQQQMLAEAERMQVQLNSRLEKSGYNRVSRMFSENIHALRTRAKTAVDRRELSAMLETLE